MSGAVIRAEGLSKRYTVPAEGAVAQADTLRDQLVSMFRSATSRSRDQHRRAAKTTDFWALRDLSFEVNAGEVLGIVGRNGAGKSTLLKVLTRITTPTSGRAEVRGRVASLLEVGTGFHHELSGRENVYANGAILGMSRSEIRKSFDEIVDFAGVSKFIDLPVKRYSSGMAVRLAFAVAAHLAAEILVIDEVLAVGDMAFQKKCIDRMGDVVKGGRTVLFVSHNLGIISTLCTKCLYLVNGTCDTFGETSSVLSRYVSSGSPQEGERVWPVDQARQGPFALHALRVRNDAGEITGSLPVGRSFEIEIDYSLSEQVKDMRLVLRIMTADGTAVIVTPDAGDTLNWHGRDRSAGSFRSRCQVPADLLNEGSYSIAFSADVPFSRVLTYEDAALGFSIEQAGGADGLKWPGLIRVPLGWDEERR
jgi:lipopolysaccharide transport system ATP-binding protein